MGQGSASRKASVCCWVRSTRKGTRRPLPLGSAHITPHPNLLMALESAALMAFPA